MKEGKEYFADHRIGLNIRKPYERGKERNRSGLSRGRKTEGKGKITERNTVIIKEDKEYLQEVNV